MLADQLEKFTNVTFVGEPSGSKATHTATRADRAAAQRHHGPASAYWQEWFPLDTRDATMPKISAPLTFDDYRRNMDPALRALATN
jgi:hypothetical protein